MYKYFCIIFVLLTITVSAQLRGPKISSPSDVFDFGTIKQGEVVKHKFTIINTGDDLLVIKNVITSCGCTAAEPESREIAPGKSTNVAVEFKSEGRQGLQTKLISVSSNDTTKQFFKFTLKGIVEEGVTKEAKLVFENETHDFGKVTEGDQLEYTFKFKNEGNTLLEIQDVKTSCGCTVAKLDTFNFEPGQSGEIKTVFDTDKRSGQVHRTITVQSNDSRLKYKVLTIRADINKKGN